MLKTFKLALTLLALVFLLAFARAQGGGGSSASPPGAAPSSQGQPALTAQERRGRALYLRGVSASGREVGAAIGELDVPAATVTCAGCHGTRGEGKTEGGVTAGGLVWSHLLKPYGHTHPTGRKHGPFDEASFARAVTNGVDPSGNELLVAMPRYRLAAEDLADLVAYLKRIETDADPGVTETSIKVGVVLPAANGPLAETGAAMKDVLAAYFESVNERGGVYGRRVELRAAAGGADGAATAAAARAFARQEQPFAFVGGLSAGADEQLADLAREEEVPFVGPSTLTPHVSSPPNRQLFYLLPGVAEQARALVNFAAADAEMKKLRAAVVSTEGALTTASASAAEDQARKAALASVVRIAYARGGFDAAQAAQRLKEEGTGLVFFFGAAGQETALLRELAAQGWTPRLFLVGVTVGRELTEAVPASFKDRVFITFPSVPSDVTPAGLAELGALREKYKVAPRHTVAQLSALAAAKVFVEALQRAGRDLTREKLIDALEGLYDFETGLTPRLTFGPNRRIGAEGAYVVTVDPEKKQLVPVGGWVKAR